MFFDDFFIRTMVVRMGVLSFELGITDTSSYSSTSSITDRECFALGDRTLLALLFEKPQPILIIHRIG